MSTSSALMAYIVYVLTFAGLLRGVVGLAVFKGSPGCGIIHKPYIDGESRSSNIESSGGLRHYSIHLPPAYDPHVQYPLMISFHGGTKTKEEQEQLSQFSNSSINPNMIAVYPHGIKNTWEVAPFANRSVDDKVFTADLLDHLNSQYCIDPQRIYASGKSDGGGFCGALACNATYGGAFAAFAPVAGAFYTDLNNSDCHPARGPNPILEFHNTDDGTIFYGGGESRSGGELPDIPGWLSRWAVRNGCLDDSSKVETPHKDARGKLEYTKVTYSCKGIANVVSHYKSERKIQSGKDHIWPTLNNSWIEASPLIIDFFNKNPKPIHPSSL